MSCIHILGRPCTPAISDVCATWPQVAAADHRAHHRWALAAHRPYLWNAHSGPFFEPLLTACCMYTVWQAASLSNLEGQHAQAHGLINIDMHVMSWALAWGYGNLSESDSMWGLVTGNAVCAACSSEWCSVLLKSVSSYAWPAGQCGDHCDIRGDDRVW